MSTSTVAPTAPTILEVALPPTPGSMFSRNHPDYIETLRWLAQNAEIHAEVPIKAQPNFESKYLRKTEETPTLGHSGYFQINGNKYGPELRVYFPEAGRDNVKMLPPTVQVVESRGRRNENGRLLRINNNDFVWELIGMGFRLGTHHDVQRIEKAISYNVEHRVA